MVADEDAGRVEVPEVVDAVDLDDSVDLLERAERFQAAGDPVRREVSPVLRLRTAPPDGGEQAGVEPDLGQKSA